jgi:crotonobetainyl-CoA:carnitine CoA-transferase CaiB-like acyl-CoA transferase
VENFSPGTLHKLGLDYDSLRRTKPELIMVSGSAYGQTGPRAQSWGVDGTSAALCSRTWLTGWPDRAPVLPSAVPYADALVPQFMITALCAALVRQQQTGAGCYIDAAMYEISVQQMTRALIASQLGAALHRAGNRDSAVWHQGVYPARGDDRWIAISLFDRQDYDRLTTLFGGEWPDPEYAPDAFDERLAQHTRALDDFALMQRLQTTGIAAGVVQDIDDVLERDPQLRARPAWVALEHPILGAFEHQTTPHHLARTPARLAPAPRLGQHDAHVCRELLGLSAEHYAELVAADVFT